MDRFCMTASTWGVDRRAGRVVGNDSLFWLVDSIQKETAEATFSLVCQGGEGGVILKPTPR